ncbi:trigger factor [Jatrophihabitans sp. YIM 134969]
MKSTVETLSPTRVKLAVELPFDEVEPSIAAAAKKVGEQIRVPGFRPGKVPARVIEQRVGRASLLNEAINELLPLKYNEALQENQVKALGQPEIEVTELDDGKVLSFTAEVDVRPEIEVPDLSAISVTVDDVEVTDADVDTQLDELRARFGTLVGVDRPVENGDFVSLDLVARVGGEEVEGGSADNLSYEVGSGDLVEGIDDAITGKSAGDDAVFESTLRNGEHAGEQAEITVTVNSVKLRELPELDDEFAGMASEFDTVDELKADIRERLGRVRLLEQGAEARDKVLEQLIETTEVPLPESAVERDVEFRKHEVIHELDHDEDRLTQLVEAEGQTREQWDADLREASEKSVKAQFILDAIADQNSLTVEDAELSKYLIRQARQYDMSPQQFAQTLMQNGNLPAVMADVRRNKALAAALDAATVTDASGNTVDLSALAPRADLAELGEVEDDAPTTQTVTFSAADDDTDED